jgi:hypothetical protein
MLYTTNTILQRYLGYHDHIKYVIIKLTLKSTIEFQTKK